MRTPFVPFFVKSGFSTLVQAAAFIPGWERGLYDSKALSESGRLFFNSNDALLSRDTNETMDVYEWEPAGVGSCTEAKPSFFPANDGCIYLISTGESPFESEFWGASPDGEDVFFLTASSLVPQDPGLVDLYDARVGGGFASATAKAPCEGEACQSPPPPPAFGTPASRSYKGPGNLAKPKPHKKKHKNKKKHKKQKRHDRRAGSDRRAAR
jgi:hypothetical protein